MNRLFLLLIILVFALACQPTNSNTQEISLLKEQLKDAQSTIQKMETTSRGRLVHVVYADLKPGTDKAAFIKEVEKLKAIEEVHNLEIGTFKDLGDGRALSEYEVVFQMDFANEREYQIYQEDPVHLSLKKAVGAYLSAPPKTYDFILQ